MDCIGLHYRRSYGQMDKNKIKMIEVYVLGSDFKPIKGVRGEKITIPGYPHIDVCIHLSVYGGVYALTEQTTGYIFSLGNNQSECIANAVKLIKKKGINAVNDRIKTIFEMEKKRRGKSEK